MTVRAAELPVAQQVRDAVRGVESAYAAMKDARDRLEALLTKAVSAFIYPGLVVDLRNYRELPECFINVRTMKGADRGTKVFRIESVPSVEVNTSHIDLSVWRCDATPISEKTGKDMSGASHGADSRATVRLQAHIVNADRYDLLDGANYTAHAHRHLLKFIERAEAAASTHYLDSVKQYDFLPESLATPKPTRRKP